MHSRVGCRANRSAFTIIELLVVIGIIGVLTSVMIPAISSARRTALATADLSNLRGLTVAHLAYINLNDERFVDVGLPHGSFANAQNSFVERLRPYFGNSPIALKSPLDQSPHWSLEAGGDGEPVGNSTPALYRRTSYGMNNYLSRTYSPLVALDGPGAGADRLQQVQNPDRIVCFLLMAEQGSFASADHPHIEDWASSPDPAKTAASQVQINAIDRRTPGSGSQSNYAFVDGHVGTLQFEDVYRSMQENKFDTDLN